MSKFRIANGVLEHYTGSGGDVVIPDSVTKIGKSAFYGCTGLTSITIPDSVTEIGSFAFYDCASLSSITIPDSVTEIGEYAFYNCASLSSITIPDGVTKIGGSAFKDCASLSSITIPDSVTEIGESAFEGCASLSSITIPDSVTEIGEYAFYNCPQLSVICPENSYAHRYCIKYNISFLFDYQFASFGGTVPRNIEKLESPFLADEEKPYIFISYSHRDRENVLPIIKNLYESGWKIWYDEGLTIGDSYDLVLEKHVRNCSAFLLFVTGNSLVSRYIDEHEIPWAKKYGKLIVKCILEEGEDYGITDADIVATVSPEDIGSVLAKIEGLTKGSEREAKGITVAVDPSLRTENYDGDGFAYCLYSERSAPDAKTVIRAVKDGGAAVYDAVEEGEDTGKLSECNCLVVFLDKGFMSDPHLSGILEGTYKAGKDVAVCLLEDVTLPDGLKELDKKQWLKYEHGIHNDLNKKLMRHLEKRGCRDTSAIPGFEYEKTDEGIVITKYTARDPHPRLEREYGGIPVIEIGAGAFKNCNFITEFRIPDSVTKIGGSAFEGCVALDSIMIPDSVKKIGEHAFSGCDSLTSITIPDSVTEIGEYAFYNCASLNSVKIPDSATEIGNYAFEGCASLSSINIPKNVTKIGARAFADCKGLSDENGFVIVRNVLYSYYGNNKEITVPDSVTEIGRSAFYGCASLSSITIPDSVTKIGGYAFSGCARLTSITIPDSVTEIGEYAFYNCASLSSITISDGVTEIGKRAFYRCTGLTSITIPDSVTEIGEFAFSFCASLSSITIPDSVTEIGEDAFWGCDDLTVACSRGSYAEKYCRKEKIRVSYI